MYRACGGGYNMHHRMTKASGGRDNYPPNNLVRVKVCRHHLWNVCFNGKEDIYSVTRKLNVFLKRFGIEVRAEKI
jgi:hypothetical protein